LEGGPPRFEPRFTRVVLLRSAIGRSCAFAYGTVALCGPRFHAIRLAHDFVTAAGLGTTRTDVLRPPTGNACPLTPARFRLVPFRSPLLRESRLISFPRGTEMFHFPRLPSDAYVFSAERHRITGSQVSLFGDPRVKGCSAPHRGLSQPSTSFVGSWCQGIHRVPLIS
jgi:hypothetical protein